MQPRQLNAHVSIQTLYFIPSPPRLSATCFFLFIYIFIGICRVGSSHHTQQTSILSQKTTTQQNQCGILQGMLSLSLQITTKIIMLHVVWENHSVSNFHCQVLKFNTLNRSPNHEIFSSAKEREDFNDNEPEPFWHSWMYPVKDVVR